MIRMPDGLVGVNTTLPNRLAHLALEAGAISGLPRPDKVEREVKIGRSRLDLRLTLKEGEAIYVEVKSSTLVRGGTALFPDAVSLRGTKHLEELTGLVRLGQRAALLVLVQRGGADCFSPADSIDPAWGQALRRAVSKGVGLFVHEVALSVSEAALGPALEARL
jgi:sugar fermentation stimulation protein A